MRLIISEEEKKSILSLHSSYGYKPFINEQDLTPSQPESPAQDEPVGLERGIGKIEDVKVTTKNFAVVKGVVKDKDGNPLPNVKITLKDKQGNSVYKREQDGEEHTVNLEGMTDDKGEYIIRAVYKENSPYTLTASLEGYETNKKRFRKDDEVLDLNLTMEKKPEEPTTTPEETKKTPPRWDFGSWPKKEKPLSKRSMERLNNKVYRELVNEFKKKNLIFYVRESESDKEPLQLQIDKGKEFVFDESNPAVVTIPVVDPKTKQPNGEIKFDCNMKPVILMRIGEESYKSRLKYEGEPYYEIKMPLEFGRDWIKINYCDRLASRTDDGKIVAPYDKR